MTRSWQGPAPQGQAVASRQAVFLHTGWRSGGTWLWSQCRALPEVSGFYEPLHEVASSLRRSDIAKIGPGSWESNHDQTAPYFEEYRSLISKGGRGVALYQPRFAFESFFLGADDDDPALEAYISALLAVPAAYDQVAVLKFCRSLGRVAWFERHFPEALHAVVVRDPIRQWHSCQRLLTEERNRYFTVAPVLVLARNAHHPLVRQACAALGVHLPRLDSADMAYGVETVWRQCKRQSAGERYRTFLAFWTCTIITALQGRAMVISPELLASATEHRDAVESALQIRIGTRVGLLPRTPEAVNLDGWLSADATSAHQVAAGLIDEHAEAIAPGNLALVWRLLDSSGAAGFDGRGCGKIRIAAPAMFLPRPPTGLAHTVRTGAAVLFARALQPLRRLHGRMSRRPRT